MIDIVIPVLNQACYTEKALNSLSYGESLPNRVIVIDNGSTDTTQEMIERFAIAGNLKIDYVRMPRNIGVNASWNLGIMLTESSHVLFLNNDVICSAGLIWGMEQIFDMYSKVGFLVPITIESADTVLVAPTPKQVETNALQKREGWCFAMPYDLIKSIGFIPFKGKNFFGDDFFYHGALSKGFRASKMSNIPCYHFGSVTLKATGAIHELHNERMQWKNQ